MKYVYEIYAPGNPGDEAIYTVETMDRPLPIARGDLLNPGSWPQHNCDLAQGDHPRPPGVVLRVTGFEHFIAMDLSTPTHKVGVFTEAVRNTRESRP